jgi:O-antigen/teichoic acid export membrane protein
MRLFHSPPQRYMSHMIGPRGKLILQTGSWSLAAKTAAAANLFLSVPFVLHALGPVKFGAWATLVSLVVFSGFLDFGFGNGTMNLVAAAHGRGSPVEVASIIREGRRTLTSIAVLLAALVLIALPLVPWYRMLGLPVELANDCRSAAAVVLFTVVLAVPLNLANRVQLAIGRGDRAFRWQALGQLATLALVIFLARASASFVVLCAAAVATPLLASLANTLSLTRDSVLAHPLQAQRSNFARRIRREGLSFFVLQLSAALAFSADLPLISVLRGPTEAGTYAIVQRLFSIIPLSLGLIWAPLWPIYRQALAAGNHDWVVGTLRNSVRLAAVVAVVAVLAFGFGFEWILSFWVHRPLAVGSFLLAGFALWSVLDAIGTALATFFNAASIMRYQVIVSVVFAVTCLTTKIWAIGHFGTSAVPWVTAATYIATSLLPTLLLGPRLLATALAKDY